MIAFLEGKIIFRGLGFIILKTAEGVGYKIFTHETALVPNENKDDIVKLWTHLHQREDCSELYGFKNFAELEFFETLIKISGVGPKTALAFFNLASIDTLKNAIASGEAAYLTKVSGIGRKIAEKIIVELKDKFGGKNGAEFRFKEDEDVYEALDSLGYPAKNIREAINKIPTEVAGAEKRIKEALKILGR